MPLYTDIASLSQTPASNAADGTTDAPSTIDNNMNLLASFIAKLRDGVGYTAGSIAAALGYTPVQQGTGTSQLTNTVKIGWSATSTLRVQVDATDFGTTWPININGNAANATNLGGSQAADYVKRLTANVMALAWDSGNGQVTAYVDGTPQPTYTTWTKVSGRPTDLASFTNSPGYMVDNDVIRRAGAVTNLGNSGSTTLTANISGFGGVSWSVVGSDEGLKENIAPTEQDSLSKIKAIDFKQFNYRVLENGFRIDDGRLHKLGGIAQQFQQIDPEWVHDTSTWLQPNQYPMLMAAMHAIKQLEARVAELECTK